LQSLVGWMMNRTNLFLSGSIFAADSKYHAFYTGYNRDYPALGKASQVLMHAISDDLVHWQKSKMELTFNPQPGYDPDDWRDPFCSLG